MILLDAGPMIALVDRADAKHDLCSATARTITRTPLITTWPCFTEAMYLLFRVDGYRTQAALWQLLHNQVLNVHHPNAIELERMPELMAKYHDLPMDLADASLVAAAEQLGIKTIFTIDSDFQIYRTIDGSSLDLIPAQ